MRQTQKSLSDILRSTQRAEVEKAWAQTDAASETGPLPAGDYVAHVAAGDLISSRVNATPGYRLTFRVCEGDYAGRRFWLDLWLTPAALPITKRDLAKIGITSLNQLDQPIPPGIRCRVTLAQRRDDDGNVRNRVQTFTVIGIETPEADPFAPSKVGSA